MFLDTPCLVLVGKHSSNIAIQNLKVLWHMNGITVNVELIRINTIIGLSILGLISSMV